MFQARRWRVKLTELSLESVACRMGQMAASNSFASLGAAGWCGHQVFVDVAGALAAFADGPYTSDWPWRMSLAANTLPTPVR